MPSSLLKRLFNIDDKAGIVTSQSSGRSAQIMLPAEIWLETIALLQPPSIVCLKHTCRFLREMCGTLDGVYDFGVAPYREGMLGQLWLSLVTHLRIGRAVDRETILQTLMPLSVSAIQRHSTSASLIRLVLQQMFGRSWSRLTFDRLVALDLTLAKVQGYESIRNSGLQPHGHSPTQVLFLQLTHLTLRICFRVDLRGMDYCLPYAWFGFFVDDSLEFPHLQNVLVFDEFKSNDIELVSGPCWTAVSMFVNRHRSTIQGLRLPALWRSHHVDGSWRARDRRDPEGYDIDCGLSQLSSLSISQAGLHGLLYRFGPRSSMTCALRSLEITETCLPCSRRSLRCRCALPQLPHLKVLRIRMSGREKLDEWMISYPTIRSLFLDTPSDVCVPYYQSTVTHS
jgi:hypothetical protein